MKKYWVTFEMSGINLECFEAMNMEDVMKQAYKRCDDLANASNSECDVIKIEQE